MELNIYQVDAFANKLFSGNPAAVCPLLEWLPDNIMQDIAIENNLSETAFFIPKEDHYAIRWFTPGGEVKLCGHATLASSFVIFNYLKPNLDNIYFESLSGNLYVTKKQNNLIELNFPAILVEPINSPDKLIKALAIKPQAIYQSIQDYLVIVNDQEQIENIKPDFKLLKEIDLRGVIVSSKGNDCDFVSRFFVPKYGIDEDPVTGSAHCILAPFWKEQLGKNKLTAKQLSKRGGEMSCRIDNDRVYLLGKAVPYMIGKIYL